MPSLFDDPYADPGGSASGGLLGTDQPRIRQPSQDNPDQGAALAQAYQAVSDYIAQQQQTSVDQGKWTGGQLWEGGHPTQAGLLNAAGQYGNALMMGTAAPGEAPPGFSVEKVQRRALAPPNEHIWKIKDPGGSDAGTIDTTWNPDTGNLHIEDFQSEGGPNTLGLTAIRQLRSALLDQYPGVKTLSGLRISGATYADRNSGSGPGRPAMQTVQQDN